VIELIVADLAQLRIARLRVEICSSSSHML
jgi:hypothetical protein